MAHWHSLHALELTLGKFKNDFIKLPATRYMKFATLKPKTPKRLIRKLKLFFGYFPCKLF